MKIDIESTMRKEARFQAELYCVLRGFIARMDAFPEWVPTDVFVEPTIPQLMGKNGSDARESKKRADLTLVAEDWSTKVQKPVLVIECKQRKIPTSNLRRYYGDALAQAEDYARAIECQRYAVYDGHNFILMQVSDPFLIGISEWPIAALTDHFARNLWHALLETNEEMKYQYLTPFLRHSDLEPWKPVVAGLIEDAMLRQAKAIGMDYPKHEAKANSQERARRYLKMID